MRHSRIMICLLAALLIAPNMTACSDKEGTETAANDTAAETAAAVETEEVDPFADFDYEGRDFRIWTSINAAAVSLGNSNYMIQGPDELTGDAAPDAAYERNLKVQELLNVNFTYEQLDNRYDQVQDTVRKYVMAGDNAHDLIINDMYGTAALTLENMFYNALDGKYFDFSQPWWYDDFMSDVSINSNYQFMLGGDYFIDILRCSHCLFYNKSLYEKIYGDSDGLYDIVLANEWTLEKFNTILEESYVDLNGDGTADIDDQYGYVSFEIWGSMIPFLVSSDPNYIDRDDRGYPYITMNNDQSVLLLDELYEIYKGGQGSWVANGLTEELAVTTFTSGRAMFVGYQRLGSLENATVREMEDGLGVVPYPKLSDSQEWYITSTHDTCEIGLIPVTVAPDDLDYISAVVEVLCRETYKSVLPVYYESSLKMKYTRDDISAQMIDIVHDNIGNSFAMAYNPSLNSIFLSGTFCTDNIEKGKTDFASSYAAREPAAISSLNKIIEDFEAKQN